MRAKITETQIRACYDIATVMKSEGIGISKAKDIVVSQAGMSASSAQYYIYNIQLMMEGRLYKSTMNPRGTELILHWVNQDFGQQILKNAIESCELHLDYYQDLPNGGPQRKIRAVVEKYISKLDSIKSDAEVKKIEKTFQIKIQESLSLDSKRRKVRLEQSSSKPKTYTHKIVSYYRNPDVVAEVLSQADGNCENCGSRAPFVRKSTNSPYLEVHHKIPLAEGGEDTVENANALCPNCHREAHYGVEWENFRP